MISLKMRYLKTLNVKFDSKIKVIINYTFW
jgi:hypothetical protein